ncbi:MAG: aldo/keto reductase [Gammaproteobacteria bacterium]|nr:aldo/keto reductase [Gammaproteobacteria bacterium]
MADAHSLNKRFVPKLGQSVNFLGLGTVELGRDWGIAGTESLHPSEEIAQAVLEAAIDRGFDIIDTASSYQLSEERIGRYIPRNEHNYLLITKPGEHSIKASDPRCKVKSYDHIYCKKPGGIYDFSKAAILNDINISLEKLKVSQLDIVLLHLANETAVEILKKGEALQTLHELKKAGKIRFIGVSVNGDALDLAIKENIDVIEFEYSLINRNNEKYIKLAHDKGMAVIIRGGLGTGLLTSAVAKHLDDPNLPYGNKIRHLMKLVDGNYDKLTQLSLAFLYRNEAISTVIVGADRVFYVDKDIQLLNTFNNNELLDNAIRIADHYPTPEQFTEAMGEYYFNDSVSSN